MFDQINEIKILEQPQKELESSKELVKKLQEQEQEYEQQQQQQHHLTRQENENENNQEEEEEYSRPIHICNRKTGSLINPEINEIIFFKYEENKLNKKIHKDSEILFSISRDPSNKNLIQIRDFLSPFTIPPKQVMRSYNLKKTWVYSLEFKQTLNTILERIYFKRLYEGFIILNKKKNEKCFYKEIALTQDKNIISPGMLHYFLMVNPPDILTITIWLEPQFCLGYLAGQSTVEISIEQLFYELTEYFFQTDLEIISEINTFDLIYSLCDSNQNNKKQSNNTNKNNITTNNNNGTHALNNKSLYKENNSRLSKRIPFKLTLLINPIQDFKQFIPFENINDDTITKELYKRFIKSVEAVSDLTIPMKNLEEKISWDYYPEYKYLFGDLNMSKIKQFNTIEDSTTSISRTNTTTINKNINNYSNNIDTNHSNSNSKSNSNNTKNNDGDDKKGNLFAKVFNGIIILCAIPSWEKFKNLNLKQFLISFQTWKRCNTSTKLMINEKNENFINLLLDSCLPVAYSEDIFYNEQETEKENNYTQSTYYFKEFENMIDKEFSSNYVKCFYNLIQTNNQFLFNDIIKIIEICSKFEIEINLTQLVKVTQNFNSSSSSLNLLELNNDFSKRYLKIY
ncbi:nnp-1 protein putative nuclear protein 1 nop52 [Anaeramoeba flamelloides]|uniref:Nnp-1 protein putative nuclear protein 1 nop52 n=1 Tax=Anaeramoeba flamelloides TaxID=1746091 RepID=A0AAV7ZZD9_9EUKA|nr:nnp-1 protein putative nuclear protein 1 nop52 [Anaeramoeba flamelloides]